MSEALKISTDMQRRFSIHVPHLKTDILPALYLGRKKRVFFLNYDGTLVSYEKQPDAVKSSQHLLNVLSKLVADPRNEVYILSGRTKKFLDDQLGHINGLGLSAENGCFLKSPNQVRWKEMFQDSDASWKDKVMEIFAYYTERTPGSFIERKDESIVWHYRTADLNFGEWQAKECQNHIADSLENIYPVHAVMGKKNIEVRPRSVSKGAIVSKVLDDASQEDIFVMAIGDERADEDVFEYLNHLRGGHQSNTLLSCTVGSKSSHANFFLTGVPEVLNTLQYLASVSGATSHNHE